MPPYRIIPSNEEPLVLVDSPLPQLIEKNSH